jgi:hypothetical protein
MHKVKFNVATTVHMIPDEVYLDHLKEMKEMKYKDFKSFSQRIVVGTEHAMLDIKIGDIVDVPNWYYEINKNRVMRVSNSFPKYRDKNGNLTPFDTEEAIKHGDMDNPLDTMKTIKMFELVETPVEIKSNTKNK